MQQHEKVDRKNYAEGVVTRHDSEMTYKKVFS